MQLPVLTVLDWTGGLTTKRAVPCSCCQSLQFWSGQEDQQLGFVIGSSVIESRGLVTGSSVRESCRVVLSQVAVIQSCRVVWLQVLLSETCRVVWLQVAVRIV